MNTKEKIVELAKSQPETFLLVRDAGRYSVAELSASNPSVVAFQMEKITRVLHGTYGDSGESWSVDLRRPQFEVTFELRPDLEALIADVRGEDAFHKARREVRKIRATKQRISRPADHSWVRWVLTRTPMGSTKLVTSEGNITPPTDWEGPVGIKRREALVMRVIQKHPRLHAIVRDRHAGAKQRADEALATSEAEAKRVSDISKIRKNWRTIDTDSWRSRSARNGGSRGYHPDALALMDKIREAQYKAADKAKARREVSKSPTVSTREESGFLSKGTWSAFEGLKLNG